MNWTVEEIPDLKGYTVEWAGDGEYLISRRNRLYRNSSLKPPVDEIGRVDAPRWKAGLSTFRLAQRLFRFMFYNVVPLADGSIFVTFDKTVGIFRNGKYETLKGLVRPCRVLRSGCAIDGNGTICFGEYLANDERGEMRIYRYRPGGKELEVAYVFQPGSIKHIHGLYFDPFTDSIFCLTGDAASECQILKSTDECQSFEVVGSGDETWRAVSLLFSEEHFTYGTDAEFRDNQIFRVDRRSLDRVKLGEVNGTVFYSKAIGGDLFFTTTAENAPSQTENVAALWHVDQQGNCTRLASFAKDIWHPTLFMFGTIHFPFHFSSNEELFFSLVGVKGDKRTFRVRRADNA